MSLKKGPFFSFWGKICVNYIRITISHWKKSEKNNGERIFPVSQFYDELETFQKFSNREFPKIDFCQKGISIMIALKIDLVLHVPWTDTQNLIYIKAL